MFKLSTTEKWCTPIQSMVSVIIRKYKQTIKEQLRADNILIYFT